MCDALEGEGRIEVIVFLRRGRREGDSPDLADGDDIARLDSVDNLDFVGVAAFDVIL